MTVVKLIAPNTDSEHIMSAMEADLAGKIPPTIENDVATMPPRAELTTTDLAHMGATGIHSLYEQAALEVERKRDEFKDQLLALIEDDDELVELRKRLKIKATLAIEACDDVAATIRDRGESVHEKVDQATADAEALIEECAGIMKKIGGGAT